MHLTVDQDIYGKDLPAPKEVQEGSQSVRYVDAGMKEGRKTVLAPGFSETVETFHPAINALTQQTGRRMYTVCNRHGISVTGGYPPSQKKVAAMNVMAQHEELRGIDGIGHSAGSSILAMAAQQDPEFLRNMVLVAPASLMDRDSVVSVIQRACMEVSHWVKVRMKAPPEVRKQWRHSNMESTRCWLTGALQMMSEIQEIAHTNIGDLLKRLQNEHDIGVSIIAPDKDKLCPIADRIGAVHKMTGVPEKHMYVMKEGMTHVPHIQTPEGFAFSADMALKTLEQEKSV